MFLSTIFSLIFMKNINETENVCPKILLILIPVVHCKILILVKFLLLNNFYAVVNYLYK